MGFNADLTGVVAVVTGASRGAGRGIAMVLGEAGATVYVTGRSIREPGATGPAPDGTIESTADAVTERGGKGVAVRCDHTDEADVIALFERVREEQGTLDLLVNDVWGGYESPTGASKTDVFMGLLSGTFWEHPSSQWEQMFTAGVRAHYLASRAAAPLLIADRSKRPGLIATTTAWAYGKYLAHVLYDLSKVATVRLAYGMAQDLREHQVASVAVVPGFLDVGETVEYLGRAVATLAADPDVMARTGEVMAVGDLAREYGFTDLDGTQPEPFRLPDPE